MLPFPPMPLASLKPHFSSFLDAAPGRLHFAAHSHHYWPDVTREAQDRAFVDARDHVDKKWGTVMGELLPRVRSQMARVLSLSDPSRIALAPNTHEFVVRLHSSFEGKAPVRILSTDGEFHSFERQTRRWEECGMAEVRRVAVEPFETLPERLEAELAGGNYDMAFFSHVLFQSGFVMPDLARLVAAVPKDDTPVVIDGYHSFMALPTDLSEIEDRAFYLSGGYKYAMSGEGACFMHCPDGYFERPVDTGWFAGFSALEKAVEGTVAYGPGGDRFLGATFDPTPFYRFDAVQRWLAEIDVDVPAIHAHARDLQARFLKLAEQYGLEGIGRDNLIPGPEFADRGNFLTFRREDAGAMHDSLVDANIITDYRADRLRFGFGIYQDESDVDQLFERMAGL